jgi:hypothetical protein
MVFQHFFVYLPTQWIRSPKKNRGKLCNPKATSRNRVPTQFCLRRQVCICDMRNTIMWFLHLMTHVQAFYIEKIWWYLCICYLHIWYRKVRHILMFGSLKIIIRNTMAVPLNFLCINLLWETLWWLTYVSSC